MKDLYNIDTWFPITIYVKENALSESENNNCIDNILKIKNVTDKGGKNWKSGVYNTLTTFDFKNDNNFINLCDSVEYNTNLFSKELSSFHNYKINESWFNFYNENDYQEFHHHSNNIFSAVYFFTNPPGSGNLVFENPIEPDMLPIKNIQKLNNFNFTTCSYNPKPRTLIIFRSYLRHMVEKCNILSPRITGAFNLI